MDGSSLLPSETEIHLVLTHDSTTRLLKDDEGDFAHEIERPVLSTMILPHYEDVNDLNPRSEPEGDPQISSVELGKSNIRGVTGLTEKGKHPASAQKRTRTTTQYTQTPPLLLAGEHAFVAAPDASRTSWTGVGLGQLPGRSY
jgi:hypothetical protein